MKLIIKLILGIVLGTLLGLILPNESLIRLLVTFKDVFGQFLGFTIPLIIIFFIGSGIASFGQESGKMLGYTAFIAYISTIFAGFLAYFVATLVLPQIITSGLTNNLIKEAGSYQAFFSLEIAPITGVMTALVAAFVFGIGVTRTKSPTLKNVLDEGKDITEKLIWKIIIPILPFYIATIFAELAADGTVFQTLKIFGMVLLLAVIMHWVWITVLYFTAGAATGRNPLSLIKVMLPAYFTGLGTMSSAATIPVTVRQAKRNQVSEPIADATIPLCATIHLSGSTITLTTCTIAVMLLTQGLSLPSFGLMIQFILLLGVIMIAAPGVPGGAVFAALGILSTTLGFQETALGLMIALYTTQDSFGTATNVTGDGAIALLVDKIMAKN